MGDHQGSTGADGFVAPGASGADGGYYVPPPTGDKAGTGGQASYPGGQGWQGMPAGGESWSRVPPGGALPGGQVPPPPSKGRGAVTVLRVLIVVAVVFGGSIWAFFTAADRGDDGAISEAGNLDVLALQVGDCFDDPSGAGEEVSSIRAIPCDQPHDNEVFFDFQLEGGALPSREAIDAQIEARCLPAFDAFVGIAYADSELDLFTFEPTAESWRQGDRTITCAVYDLSGDKLVGSARGVAR